MTIAVPDPSLWIPEPGVLTRLGRTLLEVAGVALDAHGRGVPYTRRVVTHGTDPPMVANAAQLVVSLSQVHHGLAGQLQYQFPGGNLGAVAKWFATFEVRVMRPWPTPQGQTRVQLPADDALLDAADDLWTDAHLVFAALRALALGGITVDPPATPIAQDNLLPAGMAPLGPHGTVAGWLITVEAQL